MRGFFVGEPWADLPLKTVGARTAFASVRNCTCDGLSHLHRMQKRCGAVLANAEQENAR